LRPLQREAKLTLWDDTAIKPGQQWRKEIADALKAAKVAVLLVSADFLASDFIVEHELPPLLASAEKRGTVILPVIIKPCRFKQTEGLKDYQAMNSPDDPIIGMTEAAQENVFLNLAERIEEVLHKRPKAEEALQEDDAPQKGDEVFHPGSLSFIRSALEPCTFFVNPFYRNTWLFSRYGDIQVELREHTKDPVFLIPSGRTAPHLRDTKYLQTTEGKRVVKRKQDAADVFVSQCKNQEMPGYRFTTPTKGGGIRTKVYCAAYDKCLAEAESSAKGASEA
ncbi:MAG TPA: toll/interleukin-1 receptor domain-containing protein, partial [Casimicrobiaceae bacterium]|nr:toll/interleukin-1 receptor domain-containing protein [Casimicrobiaceae bacterium]